MGWLFPSLPIPSHGMGYRRFYGIFMGFPSHLESEKLCKNQIFVPCHPTIFKKILYFIQKYVFLSSTGVPVSFIVHDVSREGSKTYRTHECEVIFGATNHKIYKFRIKMCAWDIHSQKSQSLPIPSLYIMGWDGIFMGFP